jgi:hypothetical protein
MWTHMQALCAQHMLTSYGAFLLLRGVALQCNRVEEACMVSYRSWVQMVVAVPPQDHRDYAHMVKAMICSMELVKHVLSNLQMKKVRMCIGTGC